MFEITLQETRVYREAKEEGLKLGLELGRQEGLKQALEEIREKGREQAKLELIPRCLAYGISIEEVAKLFNLTAKAGFFVQVGVPEGAQQNISIGCGTLVVKEITLVGSLVGSRGDIVSMLQLCADKNIYPVNEEFSFEDFPKAFDKLEHGKPIYRCIVNVHDFAKKHFTK